MNKILLLIVTSIYIYGSENNIEIILEILDQKNKALSYIEHEESNITNEINGLIVRYSKKSSDGFLMERTESTAYEGSRKLYFLTEIINRTGSWQIEGCPPKKIINAKYLLNNERTKDKIYGEKPKNNLLWFIDERNILLEEGSENINNKSTIKLSLKLKDEAYQQLFEMKSKEVSEIYSRQLDAANKKFKSKDKNYKPLETIDSAARTPYLCEINFVKEEKKIVRIKIFNKEGTLISIQNITNISYNIPIDDNLFEVPNKPYPIRANSWEEYLQISDK